MDDKSAETTPAKVPATPPPGDEPVARPEADQPVVRPEADQPVAPVPASDDTVVIPALQTPAPSRRARAVSAERTSKPRQASRSGGDSTPASGRARRLRDLLTASPRPIHWVIAVMCLVLGFALVTQIKLQRSDPLDNLHEDELVTLLDQLTNTERQLRQQRNDLTIQVQRLQSSRSQFEAAQEAAEQSRRNAQILAGAVAVHGPGLTITMQEGTEPITANTFVNVLGELRNAGAEAIDIDGQRVTAATYISRADAGMSISGFIVTSPYRWSVIGDPDTLQPALEIPRGALSRVRGSGATVTFERFDDLRIVSLAPEQSYRYAEVK